MPLFFGVCFQKHLWISNCCFSGQLIIKNIHKNEEKEVGGCPSAIIELCSDGSIAGCTVWAHFRHPCHVECYSFLQIIVPSDTGCLLGRC